MIMSKRVKISFRDVNLTLFLDNIGPGKLDVSTICKYKSNELQRKVEAIWSEAWEDGKEKYLEVSKRAAKLSATISTIDAQLAILESTQEKNIKVRRLDTLEGEQTKLMAEHARYPLFAQHLRGLGNGKTVKERLNIAEHEEYMRQLSPAGKKLVSSRSADWVRVSTFLKI